MVSHQISLRDDIYNKLKALKRNDESYSDVIDRLIDSKMDKTEILELYGIAGEDDLGLMDSIISSRKEIESTLNKRFTWE